MTLEMMQTVGWYMVFFIACIAIAGGIFIEFFFDPSASTWNKIGTFVKWWLIVAAFFIVFPHLYWWFD